MSGRRILVVDDSALSRAVIQRVLTKRGHEVLLAEDGAQGAVLALQERPDLVVTDLDMPVMDGYQLARLLKSDPATRHVAVLILTSHREASSRFWGLETGADAYLVKDEIEERLPEVLDGVLAEARPAEGVATEIPKSPLEVLGRVSRHLDQRLLEAVVVNRLLERGMKAEALVDSAHALLEVLEEIVDFRVLGLAIAEPDSTTILFHLHPDVQRTATATIVEVLEGDLAGADVPRDLSVRGGSAEGEPLDLGRLRKLELSLRGARALLLVLPRSGGRWEESREARLLDRSLRHAALVLDNARLSQRLRELSMQDGLTRLLNRRTVRMRLDEEIGRAQRYAHPLSLVLLDLDHFKSINDTYGHPAGDAVLLDLAELLRERGRAADIAGRYGGEEFVLVFPETSLEAARAAAERLRVAIESRPTVLPDGYELHVTSSFGVAALSDFPFPEDASSDDLLGLADQRLYQAKDNGRNRVVP